MIVSSSMRLETDLPVHLKNDYFTLSDHQKMSFTQLSTDNEFEIARQGVTHIHSISEWLKSLASVETLHNISWGTVVPKNKIPPFMNKRMWQSVFAALGFKLPDKTAPDIVAKYNGLFEMNYVDTTVDDYWSYFLIRYEREPSISFYNSLNKKVYSSSGEIQVLSSNYCAVMNDYRLTVLGVGADGQIYEASSIENVMDNYVPLAESSNGPLVLVTNTNNELLLYGLQHRQFVLLKNLGQYNNRTINGAGYNGYYMNGQIQHYSGGEKTNILIKTEGDVFVGAPPQGTTYNEIAVNSSNGMGVDVVKFKSQHNTLFCEEKDAVLDVLWSTKQIGIIAMVDSLVVFSNKICDLFTGEIIFDSPESDDIQILGITKKKDHSGYYVWMNSNILDEQKKDVINQWHAESLGMSLEEYIVRMHMHWNDNNYPLMFMAQ